MIVRVIRKVGVESKKGSKFKYDENSKGKKDMVALSLNPRAGMIVSGRSMRCTQQYESARDVKQKGSRAVIGVTLPFGER